MTLTELAKKHGPSDEAISGMVKRMEMESDMRRTFQEMGLIPKDKRMPSFFSRILIRWYERNKHKWG